MSRLEGQKAKVLHLLHILEQYTDEEHRMNVPQILEKLAQQGIKAERKSVYDDIESLKKMGYDIHQSRGRCGGYFLGERALQLSELKLLVDSVQASRFITRKKSDQLIATLTGLFASQWQAQDLKRQVYSSGQVKSMNESIYYTVDALHRAIAQNRQVGFKYQHWTLDKKKTSRGNGSEYRVSPWALLWEDENYYLVAYQPEKGLRHYRVDKMASIHLLEQERQGEEIINEETLRSYARPLFHMFGGPAQKVTLRCQNAMIDPILDRFGTQVLVMPQPDGWFTVQVEVTPSRAFYGWVFGFAGQVQIHSPASVRNEFAQQLAQVQAGLAP